jgi:conjugal transfer/entry exclusion protein
MIRRCTLIIVVLALVAVPVSAQLLVIDPDNLAQVVLIAQRAQQLYEQLQAEYQIVTGMAQGLSHLDAYRTPAVGITGLDATNFPYGRAWIEGMNGGDARGTAYFATAVPLQRPETNLDRLGTRARRLFENQYATVEISDSVAMMGGHQVALLRAYHGQLQDAVQRLEDDVVHPSSDYHQLTALLDKISAGELVGRRQDMAANQLLSHALEQLLARNKRQRDTEAMTINMQLTTWRDGQAANDAFVAGSGDALRTWRQP